MATEGKIRQKIAGVMMKDRLSVVLLIGQLGLGGTEKQVALLAAGLRERGADVAVWVMFGRGPRESELAAAGVPVVELGFGRLTELRRVPRNIVAFLRTVVLLLRRRPDVLHAFLIASYLVAAPAARLARVPILVAGRRSLGDFKEGHRVVLAVERLANRWTDHIIANAEAVALDALRQERLPAGKVTVVHNGLPDRAFEVAGGAPARSVLCVANLKAYKGHEHLLAALSLLPEPPALVLVGEGPQRPALEAQAARLGLAVTFAGARTDPETFLAAAGVFVLPSLEEGMSNAVMEAMAAGLPVIGTAVGGTPELLRGGRGVLVPPADPEALATALERVLADPAEAARLGAAARAWAVERLTAAAMVDRHVEIYHRLLGDPVRTELSCAR
jgi:glycosyltransferase involved in cell wall biosynthesis